jgi:hypothetical protein
MPKVKSLIAFAASTALIASSTAAVAAAPATSAPLAQPQNPDAWMMLSVLSPTNSVALGGAAAAAQPAPPPSRDAGAVAGFNGEFLPVILWFGLIAIALTIKGSSAHVAPPVPNSAS